MEEAIVGDYSLVKAWKADPYGNLMFRYGSRLERALGRRARLTRCAAARCLLRPLL